MIYLLRKITGDRWLNSKIPANDDDFPADPVTDLKTDGNTLSVFLIQKKKHDMNAAIVGLASNSTSLQKITYALIKLRDIEAEGFVRSLTPGKTPHKEANLLHEDIEKLTANDLLRLAKLIHKKAEKATIPRPKIALLVMKAYKQKKLVVERISHGIHKELKISCAKCKVE